MKVLFLLALLLSLAGSPAAQAQVDTTQARYYQPIFPVVTVTSGVAYGSAVTFSGLTQTLLLDIYQPTDDTVRRRSSF